MGIPARKRMVAALFAVFVFQTVLVYADPSGRLTPRLSELARAGQELWHQHNCQACHQLYGFGGFLGPDLTNASRTLTPARLEGILVSGRGQMPAFGLDEAQRAAIGRFLEEIDKTGVGQVKVAKVTTPRQLLLELVDSVVDGSALTEAEARGRDFMVAQNCLDCHLPNQRSAHRAPDLVTASQRLTEEQLLSKLQNGVPGTAMPKFRLSPEDRAGLLAFLRWLTANQSRILAGFAATGQDPEGSLLDLPWFEYR